MIMAILISCIGKQISDTYEKSIKFSFDDTSLKM